MLNSLRTDDFSCFQCNFINFCFVDILNYYYSVKTNCYEKRIHIKKIPNLLNVLIKEINGKAKKHGNIRFCGYGDGGTKS